MQEWFHFVDKEKQVRIRIDGKVNQMIAESAELKQWTITEVCCCAANLQMKLPMHTCTLNESKSSLSQQQKN